MFETVSLLAGKHRQRVMMTIMLVFASSLTSGLFAQPLGFFVEVDPELVVQGDEPMTFTASTQHPVAIERYEWVNGFDGEVLGTGSTITLDPNFTESTMIGVKAIDADGQEGRGFSFIQVGNGPPTGFAVFVDPPFVVQGDQPIVLEAATQHANPIVSYEWINDLTGDVLGTTQSITLEPNFTEPTPISVKLTDDMGETGLGGSFIDISGNGPAGFFVLVDPPVAIQGDDPIVFQANVPEELEIASFEWKRLDTGEVLGSEQSLTLQPNFESTTDIEVTATATDNQIGKGFATVIVGNQIPDILFVTVDPPVVIQGDDPIELTASVENSNITIASYRWTNDVTGEVIGDTETITLQPNFTEPTVISCEITDSDGKTGLGCSLILPDDGNLPGFGVAIDPPVIVQEDQPLVFNAVPGEGIVPASFAWVNLNTGEALGTTQSITLEPTFEEVTTLAVTLRDNQNREYRAEALILVDPVGPPELGVFVEPPVVFQGEDPITFTAQVNGAQGTGTLSYEWIREDTNAVIGSEASITLNPEFTETTSVRVKVMDDQNRTGEGYGLIIVGGITNEPWVMVDPPFTEQGEDPMTFTATLTEGRTAASFAWFDETSGASLGDTASITLNPNFSETTTIRVDVVDTEGNEQSARALIFVIDIPEFFDVAVNPPLAVQTDQPIVLSAVIPENVQATKFVWTNLSTGEEVGTAQTITLTPDFETSTSIGVRVTAADGSIGRAFSIIVVSQVSANFTVTVDPAIVNQGIDPLEFTATPPEGVTISGYEWFNSETGDSLGTGQTLRLTELFQSPTLIRVEATDDGGGLGVGYAIVMVFPAGPDPNGDGQNTLADLHHELPNWQVQHSVKELMMINIGH